MATTLENGKVRTSIPPPDKEEEALAKIVFGDESDFQLNLAKFTTDYLLGKEFDELGVGLSELGPEAEVEGEEEKEEGEEEEGTENELEQINDDQLFFVDDEAGERQGHGQEQTQTHHGDADLMDVDHEGLEGPVDIGVPDHYADAAWVDSDDERINISITGSSKTKKLRSAHGESSIDGATYITRLRTQFERIYPRPKWADEDEETVTGADGKATEDDEDNDMGSDRESEQVLDGDTDALSKILQSTYTYTDTSHSKLLPSRTIDIIRQKDANASHPSMAGIQSLSFHPFKPLLLTGGFDKTLRIYHIDGKFNHLVTSLYIRDTPVRTCAFYVSPLPWGDPVEAQSRQDQRIFTGGRRKYMHSWDLSTVQTSSANSFAKIEKFNRMYGHEATQQSFEKFKLAHYCNMSSGKVHGIILLQGSSGWINILHAVTGIWLMGCKIEGLMADYCVDYQPFSEGKFKTILIVANTHGEVWEFDLNDGGRTLARWQDEGGFGITTIQVGGGTSTSHLFPTRSGRKVLSNRWLAIGSSSGYVNIYERRNGFMHSLKPSAELGQLTTTISNLEFSPDGQILCMASRAKKDALRLVHLPSCTVFTNWPTSNTPLGKVLSVAFSPHGEMLAVGNEQGKVRLWRLSHY